MYDSTSAAPCQNCGKTDSTTRWIINGVAFCGHCRPPVSYAQYGEMESRALAAEQKCAELEREVERLREEAGRLRGENDALLTAAGNPAEWMLISRDEMDAALVLGTACEDLGGPLPTALFEALEVFDSQWRSAYDWVDEHPRVALQPSGEVS